MTSTAAGSPTPRGSRPVSVLGSSSHPVALADATPVFSVGQVAALLGVPQALLRRLDEHRIVRPARSVGGQRRYSQLDVRQVSTALDMVDDGISLPGVCRIIELQAQIALLRKEITRLKADPGADR